MKVGVAGIPGAWSSERLAASLRAQSLDSFVFSPMDVLHRIDGGIVECDGHDLSTLDGIAVKKLGDQSDATTRLRLHAFRALEAAGVRVFSPPDVIDRAMDRYRMTMGLAAAGLPIPDTLAVESATGVATAVARLGESVLKPVYTSKGRGMVRLENHANTAAAETDGRVLVQRFVDAPGRDIGATVIDGRFLGAFYRVAQAGEWMTTTSRGGTYAPCKLSPLGIEYAERAARAFELDYTVVDLVEQPGDEFVLYEVSAFGGFRGLWEASRIDASLEYARYIRRTLESR